MYLFPEGELPNTLLAAAVTADGGASANDYLDAWEAQAEEALELGSSAPTDEQVECIAHYVTWKGAALIGLMYRGQLKSESEGGRSATAFDGAWRHWERLARHHENAWRACLGEDGPLVSRIVF